MPRPACFDSHCDRRDSRLPVNARKHRQLTRPTRRPSAQRDQPWLIKFCVAIDVLSRQPAESIAASNRRQSQSLAAAERRAGASLPASSTNFTIDCAMATLGKGDSVNCASNWLRNAHSAGSDHLDGPRQAATAEGGQAVGLFGVGDNPILHQQLCHQRFLQRTKSDQLGARSDRGKLAIGAGADQD